MIFGTSEVIRPINPDLIEAVKKIWRFGEVKTEISKIASSHVVKSKEEALGHVVPALKHLESGNSHYTYIEVFTDEQGISRMVVCHMERTK
jgi:hypothetical protein